jgi:methanogenic corrinoid protein MtbC1
LITRADMTLPEEHASNVGRPNYRRYWLALYRRRVEVAERVLDSAMASWPARRIYHRLFEPALALSGTLFARGVISYDDEHFITFHTTRLMRRVRHTFVPRHPTGPLALASGVGQESHLIGLRMVCDFMQAANWRISWLATHERGVFRDAVRREAPAAVLLSLGRRVGVIPAQRVVRELRRSGYRGVIAVGGLAIVQEPELVGEIGADLTARNGLDLLRQLRRRGLGSQARKE